MFTDNLKTKTQTDGKPKHNKDQKKPVLTLNWINKSRSKTK